ncbi:MAG TPA: electron transfer flavoprotein subunit beta/FixA family protein, partial [Flexilinea sp.]|nr:electron transfer flavoprotein subunit beta/FixA family protein [Flexilinea sp.]
LREAYMLGIDHGILLTDRKFGGADCLATAYTLSQAILKIGLPDLIICGKQTTDGDTAQVGSELAEFLELPHIACVLKINSLTNRSLEGVMDLGDFTQTVELPFPCLITVDKEIYEPRLPSYRKKIATRDRPIQTLSFSELPDQNPVHYGLDGSATRVMRVFPPVHHKQNQIFEGTPDTLASEISKILIKMKVL